MEDFEKSICLIFATIYIPIIGFGAFIYHLLGFSNHDWIDYVMVICVLLCLIYVYYLVAEKFYLKLFSHKFKRKVIELMLNNGMCKHEIRDMKIKVESVIVEDEDGVKSISAEVKWIGDFDINFERREQ